MAAAGKEWVGRPTGGRISIYTAMCKQWLVGNRGAQLGGSVIT